MGAFSASIGRFTKQVKAKEDAIIRKAGLMVLNGVQKRTPVDTGQLRASWTASVNQLPANYGGNTQSIHDATFGDTIFIATNKPYAIDLEYGLYPQPSKTGKTTNGYSIQAPQGMVRITVEEVKAKLKRGGLIE